MVHTYRNRERNKRLVWDSVGGLMFLALGLGAVAALFAVSPLTLLVTLPLFLLWMAPIYADFFRRYYEIRLSDEGECEFRAVLGTRYLRAQQITSVARNNTRVVRWEGDEAEHTLLRLQGGSLVVVQPIDGFEDFLTRLQALNPAIELSGSPGDPRPSPETPDEHEERGTPVNRLFRGALFPLIVIALLVYLASQTLPGR